MRALWIARGELTLRDDVALAPVASDEARVRVLRAGICGTDLALLDGLYPFEGIPGHEFVGVVASGPDELVGRRVVAEINVSCGRCRLCRAGIPKHCDERAVLGIRARHGAFAELIDVPRSNLHAVPDGVSTEHATFTEPLAAALEAANRIMDRCDAPVLVLGAGRLGQLVCRVLAARGIEVVVAGRDARKLARLAGVAGDTLQAEQVAPRSFDAVVECTGSPAGLPIAIRALRPTGTLILKSTHAGAAEMDTGSVVVNELSVQGSRCGPFDEALRMLERGGLALDSLIDDVYPLSRGVQAFDRSREAGVVKVMLDMRSRQ